MKITVLHATPLEVLMRATRISHASTDKLDTQGNELGPNDKKLLERIIKLGHTSVLEHIVYSIRVEDVSRALLQQIVRHRHVSFTVESTRFALHKILSRDLEDLCVWPPEVDEEFKKRMLEQLEFVKSMRINDVAKYALPECLKTRFVMTTNAREIESILQLRLSPNAMWEIRQLAFGILEAVSTIHPDLWSIMGYVIKGVLE